jgi:DNA-binding GntR family transcriptional regulator
VERRGKKKLARYTAYEAIKNKILYLELRPGDVISETQIAKNLGTGRTPAREALLLLEKEGLIEIKENVGFSVRTFGIEELEEYRVIRSVIEEYAVAMAIQRMTADEVGELRKNLDGLKACVADGNFLNSVKYETEFHEIIYRAARSDVVRETISGLNSKFLWIRAASLTRRENVAQCLAEHTRIFKEIEAKNVAGAQKGLRRHLKHGWGNLRDLRWLFRSPNR